MNTKITFRDYPTSLWVFAVVAPLAGIYLYLRNPDQLAALAIGGGIFLVIALFSSILTVTADKTTGILIISHHSLLRRSTREILIGQIAAIQVEQSVSHDDGSRSTTYRIIAVLKDGEVIPFRSAFTGRAAPKENRARELREFLHIGGSDHSLRGILSGASQQAQAYTLAAQESITGIQEKEHITDGVRWKLETVTFAGSPVTRWFSLDFRFPGQFLYLAQKMQGQKTPSGKGLLSSMNKMMFKQSMKIYGFDEEEAPSLDYGELLSPLNPMLEPHFIAFTSDPESARQILNARVSASLANWAQRYPLKQGTSNQLTVLIGGEGLYLAMLGLTNPEHLDELAHLGAEIILAQG